MLLFFDEQGAYVVVICADNRSVGEDERVRERLSVGSLVRRGESGVIIFGCGEWAVCGENRSQTPIKEGPGCSEWRRRSSKPGGAEDGRGMKGELVW